MATTSRRVRTVLLTVVAAACGLVGCTSTTPAPASSAGTDIDILHTPGHSPGSVSLHLPDLAALFTGDTLFAGGPGATGRSFSDFDTIIDSIRDRLLTLPEETTVHTGHGDTTTIGTERPALADWIARGH